VNWKFLVLRCGEQTIDNHRWVQGDKTVVAHDADTWGNEVTRFSK
jgi:hypothetical protein